MRREAQHVIASSEWVKSRKKRLWVGLSVLLLLIVVLAVAYVSVIELTERTIESNFKANATTQVQIINKSMTQYLEQVFNDIEMLASFPSFRGVGKGLTVYTDRTEPYVLDPTKGSEEEQHLYEIMNIYGISHPGTIYVYLATEYSGYLCWPPIKLSTAYNPLTRPWYKDAVAAKGKVVQTDPYIDLATGNLIISNVKAIYDDERKLKGVFGIDVSMSQIADVVNEAQVKDSFFLVVHDSGLILADTSNQVNDFQYLTDTYPVIGEHYATNGIFDITLEDGDYLAMSNNIDGTKWHIIVLSKRSSLYGQSQGYIRNVTLGTVFFVGALLFIILGGAYMLFYNRTLQRLVSIRTQNLQDMIDELIHKDQGLRASEERVRSLIENIPGIVYRCLPQAPWQMVTISNWVEKITGYEAKLFLGDKQPLFWEDLIFPEDLDRVKAVETERIGHYFEMEYRIINKQGQLRWVFERGGLIADENGNRFMDGVIIDITDRKQAENEIKRLYEEMEQRVELRTKELKNAMSQLVEQEKMASLGGIVSGVAHEINTPLGISVTIASYLKKLSDELAESVTNGTLSKSKLKDFMHQNNESYDILQTNLSRAADLVNSFKKISVNQSSEERVSFHVKEYLEMILLSLKHEYKNKGYQIEISCPDQLEVYSYPGVFSQILTNFLMNSFIHGFKNRNEGHISITVTNNKETDSLCVVYKDDGKGIKKEHLEHIFDPFFTTNRANGGSGLGLYIVYNLVNQKLGGNLQCSSVLGEGTEFKIVIPMSHLRLTWQE